MKLCSSSHPIAFARRRPTKEDFRSRNAQSNRLCASPAFVPIDVYTDPVGLQCNHTGIIRLALFEVHVHVIVIKHVAHAWLPDGNCLATGDLYGRKRKVSCRSTFVWWTESGEIKPINFNVARTCEDGRPVVFVVENT